MGTLINTNEGPWIDCGYQNPGDHKPLYNASCASKRPNHTGMVLNSRLSGSYNALDNCLYQSAHKMHLPKIPIGGSKQLKSGGYSECVNKEPITVIYQVPISKSSNIRFVRETTIHPGLENQVLVETDLEELPLITSHANITRGLMTMTTNGLIYIAPRVSFYGLEVNFGEIKIHLTQGMIISAAERMAYLV